MIIDGHNDLVLHRWRGEPTEHLDLDAALAAGFSGGFFALYVPSPRPPDPTEVPYAIPLPDPIPHEEAARIADELFAALCELPVVRATSTADFQDGRVTAIVHLEGAEPIAPDLSNLEWWYERGLRSIGLTWSRPNLFAEGVPFQFPSTSDTGGGLTAAGRRARARLQPARHPRRPLAPELARVLGRRSACRTRRSSRPTRTPTRSVRRLATSTTSSWTRFAESGGVVGVNFAVTFLREDGLERRDTPLAEIVRHVDYLVDRMGIDHVALGSDFDGCVVSDELGGAAGLPKLVAALRSSGHDDDARGEDHAPQLATGARRYVAVSAQFVARRSRVPASSSPAPRPD